MNKVTEITEYQNCAAVAAQTQADVEAIERVLVQGDLSKLSPEQRVIYYKKVCDSLGLNPYTKPFDYIMLNGKLTLYAKKDATEQLRRLNGISIEKLETCVIDDLYIVKASAKARDGRTDVSTAAVTIGNLKGDAKANALMKCETKAKRRVTLSISGLGLSDEGEIETIPSAKKVDVSECGEIIIERITKQQAVELEMILSECGENYRKWFMTVLAQNKVLNIEDMPLEMYPKARETLIKRMNEVKEAKIKNSIENEVQNESTADN